MHLTMFKPNQLTQTYLHQLLWSHTCIFYWSKCESVDQTTHDTSCGLIFTNWFRWQTELCWSQIDFTLREKTPYSPSNEPFFSTIWWKPQRLQKALVSHHCLRETEVQSSVCPAHTEGWEPEGSKWHFTNFTGEPKQNYYHSLIWLCTNFNSL